MKGSPCPSIYLHRILHGRRETRSATDKHGALIEKTYKYPGIPHHDLAPMTITVKETDAALVAAKFKHLGVSYLEIHPKNILKFGKWDNQQTV